jgi:hypothetical protein
MESGAATKPSSREAAPLCIHSQAPMGLGWPLHKPEIMVKWPTRPTTETLASWLRQPRMGLGPKMATQPSNPSDGPTNTPG